MEKKSTNPGCFTAEVHKLQAQICCHSEILCGGVQWFPRMKLASCLHVTLSAARILKWLLGLWKICAPVLYGLKSGMLIV